MGPATAFIPYSDATATNLAVRALRGQPALVEKTYPLTTNGSAPIDGAQMLQVDSMESTSAVAKIARSVSTSHTMLLLNGGSSVELGEFALDRFAAIAQATNAA